MAVSRLLKSWAMPPASTPRLSSFWAWRRASSVRWSVRHVVREEGGPGELAVLVPEGGDGPVAEAALARAEEDVQGDADALPASLHQGLAALGKLRLSLLGDQHPGIPSEHLRPGVAEDALRRGVPLLDAEVRIRLDHGQGGVLQVAAVPGQGPMEGSGHPAGQFQGPGPGAHQGGHAQG